MQEYTRSPAGSTYRNAKEGQEQEEVTSHTGRCFGERHRGSCLRGPLTPLRRAGDVHGLPYLQS